MARSSMADVILILRGLTSAGSAEYTVNGSAYWTDDQLQSVLDRHAQVVRAEVLEPMETMETGGSVAFYDYQSPRRFFEGTNAGTAGFVVLDEKFTPIGTAAWIADYAAGRVTFGTTTLGLTRYVTGKTFDMNAAAGDVWTQKAAHYVTAYDVSTDNHSLSRSQIIKNCLEMAKQYNAGAQVVTVNWDRGDVTCE